MDVINRTAVTVVPAAPFIAWTQQCEADFNAGTLTVARATPHGMAFLLPEVDDPSDLREWVEDNYAAIFEFQLTSWTATDALWPQDRSLGVFREWFRVELHGMVVDVVGDADDEEDDEDDDVDIDPSDDEEDR